MFYQYYTQNYDEKTVLVYASDEQVLKEFEELSKDSSGTIKCDGVVFS